jgi:hypothetical protein
MVIPAPLEVDALMRHVPKGRVTTINQIRQALARKHRVDFACPITTGIFAWIAAHAAAQARHLRAEGLNLEPGRGKKPPKVKVIKSYVFS